MKIRLFYKLFAVFFLTGLVVVAIATTLLERELKSAFIGWIGDELTAEAHIIALMPPDKILLHAAELAERSRSRLTLIDAAGWVTADSELHDLELDSHLNRSEIQEARVKGLGMAVRYSHTLRKEMIYVAVPLREGSQVTGYVRMARPLREFRVSIEELRNAIFDILLLIVTISLLIALVFVMKAVTPIRTLAAFTERIRAGKVSGMIRIKSRDEIGVLAQNINDMVAALQEKIRAADEETEKLQALFAGMAEGIMVLDARGRIETVNRGMEEMLGRRDAEIAGKTPLEAFRNVQLHDALELFRETGETVFREIRLEEARTVVVDATISAVRSEGDGKTLLVFHDVTRLKKLERIRTDFVANITHEIKTPLTAIIGFVETLQEGALDEKERALKFLQTIRENAQRLSRLVDDLLILSGIELGEVKLNLAMANVEEAINAVLAVVAAPISEKKLEVVTDIPKDLPAIAADRDRLAQILLNIIDNAVKFTPPGGKITVAASPGEQGRLTVRISDTGIGIPEGEIPRLGERFYRADKTRSREQGGTGLGLSIVKHLMTAHRGRMSIESAPGRGTTVSLAFPLFRDPA